MKVNSKNEAVEVVYTSTNGTKIFAHKDITQISAFRGVAAEKNKRFASLCLTEAELKNLINTALDGVNKKQDFAQAISILHEIKFRSEMICEENSLLELAYIYLMIEGEDLDKPTQEFNTKKAALMEAEHDLKRFFFAKGSAISRAFFTETRNRFTFLFGGNKESHVEVKPVYAIPFIESFDSFMGKMIYAACDGKVADIKALEGSTYWEFCSVLNNYLEKVELHNKQVEKMQKKLNSGERQKKKR